MEIYNLFSLGFLEKPTAFKSSENIFAIYPLSVNRSFVNGKLCSFGKCEKSRNHFIGETPDFTLLWMKKSKSKNLLVKKIGFFYLQFFCKWNNFFFKTNLIVDELLHLLKTVTFSLNEQAKPNTKKY